MLNLFLAPVYVHGFLHMISWFSGCFMHCCVLVSDVPVQRELHVSDMVSLTTDRVDTIDFLAEGTLGCNSVR